MTNLTDFLTDDEFATLAERALCDMVERTPPEMIRAFNDAHNEILARERAKFNQLRELVLKQILDNVSDTTRNQLILHLILNGQAEVVHEGGSEDEPDVARIHLN